MAQTLEGEYGRVGYLVRVAKGAEMTAGEVPSIGNYQVLRFLGEGGMGRVYVARHTVLDRDVVVKRILPELVSNPEVVRRFLVEARAAARLEHRNIVVVHDAATDQAGVPYIALEHLHGKSLRAWIDQRRVVAGPFVAPTLVALILSQAGNALTFAHGQHIIHRDIKPDNIFLVRAPSELAVLLEASRLPADLFVKVLDFGIAKLADEPGQGGTGTNMALGTPAYMPAEQLRGARDVDFRADVYALGAVAYELLTGEVPWGDTGFAELHGRMMHEPTPDPRKRNPALPRRIAQVVVRALKREPDDRWQTVADFVRAFAAEVPAGDGLPSGAELLRVYAPELTQPTAAKPPAEVGPTTEQLPGSRASLTPQAAVVATLPPARSRRGLVISIGAVAAVGVMVLAMSLGAGGGAATSAPDAMTPSAAPADVALDAARREAPIDGASADADAIDAAPVLAPAAATTRDAGAVDASQRRTRHPADPPNGAGTGSSHGIRVIK